MFNIYLASILIEVFKCKECLLIVYIFFVNWHLSDINDPVVFIDKNN